MGAIRQKSKKRFLELSRGNIGRVKVIQGQLLEVRRVLCEGIYGFDAS